jgi:GNAT superfamily N-acetyltransferase
MTTLVRQAEQHDATELTRLFALYRQFFTETLDLEGSQRFIDERLRLGDSVIIVAVDGERPIGFLQLYPLFSSWYAKRIWFLSDLYVDEAFRNANIGRALVEYAKQFAHDGGSASIMVEIPHSEPHLVKFYQELNFTRDKVFDLYRYYLTE